MSSRLASVAPDLVPRLNSCPDEVLRSVVAVVAEEAVARTGLEGLLSSSSPDRAAVLALVDRLDTVAWDLEELEGHDSPLYVEAFRRARAAAAVAYALEPDRSSALESVYEAQAALGSIDELRALIEPWLTSS